MKSLKQHILDAISDLCADFLFYDRKEDEILTPGVINDAVEKGEITIDEMVAEFRSQLETQFQQK